MQNDENSKQPVLIITGMHRSGTSLIASLLQSAGLDIGQALLEGNISNVKGHFENLDFFNFHQAVLLSIGTNNAGFTLQRDINVPEHYVDEARLLIQKSASLTNPWGWKDPRTTLFLNFWDALLPEATFLLVYRSPWEVIDSFYRRGDPIFQHNPKLALDVWMNYNQIVLDFYNRFPDKCFLTHLKRVTDNPAAFIESVNQKLSLSLDLPEKDIYDASLLSTSVSSSQRTMLIQRYFPDADRLYQQLNCATGFSDNSTLPQELMPQPAWLLKDWLDLRCLQKKLKDEVTGLQEQLLCAQENLAKADLIRQQLQVANQQLQEEKQKNRAEIDQLLEKEAQFKHQFQWQLEQKQAAIDAMETSKFWKLRSQWLKLKLLFQPQP